MDIPTGIKTLRLDVIPVTIGSNNLESRTKAVASIKKYPLSSIN